MNAVLKKCTLQNLPALQKISIDTYFETFEKFNSKENMDAYLQDAFNAPKLTKELSDLNSEFYFLFCDRQLAGYLKINEVPSQTDIHDPQSLEIERFYILRAFQGNGMGQFMMDHALSLALARTKKYVWLGVWEHNEKAKRFYHKNGFYKIGAHSFIMGDDDQTDFVLRKDLTL